MANKKYNKILTEKKNSRSIKSKKPAYFISKLSKVKKRPECSSSLYSALHGPTANQSQTWYSYPGNCDEEHRRHMEGMKVLKRNDISLHLYHGKRYCVGGEGEGDGGLFHRGEDASGEMYDHQKRKYEFFETSASLMKFLRRRMKLEGHEHFPVFKHEKGGKRSIVLNNSY